MFAHEIEVRRGDLLYLRCQESIQRTLIALDSGSDISLLPQSTAHHGKQSKPGRPFWMMLKELTLNATVRRRR